MTPGEHYLRAEELLAADTRVVDAHVPLLRALVHATLATATDAHRRAYPPPAEPWPEPQPVDDPADHVPDQPRWYRRWCG